MQSMQSILLCISIALIAGLLSTRPAKRIGLPAVTAYLLTGLLLGPYFLGRLGLPGIGFHSMEDVSTLGIISDMALGFIAFTIGNEFRLEQLKHMDILDDEMTVMSSLQPQNESEIDALADAIAASVLK